MSHCWAKAFEIDIETLYKLLTRDTASVIFETAKPITFLIGVFMFVNVLLISQLRVPLDPSLDLKLLVTTMTISLLSYAPSATRILKAMIGSAQTRTLSVILAFNKQF